MTFWSLVIISLFNFRLRITDYTGCIFQVNTFYHLTWWEEGVYLVQANYSKGDMSLSHVRKRQENMDHLCWDCTQAVKQVEGTYHLIIRTLIGQCYYHNFVIEHTCPVMSSTVLCYRALPFIDISMTSYLTLLVSDISTCYISSTTYNLF